LNILGRSFQLPPAPRREIIGMNLSNNASRNLRKRNLSTRSPNPYVTQSPLTRYGSYTDFICQVISLIFILFFFFKKKNRGMASPRERASLLSPAARKLLRKSNLPKSVGVDVQLRASYAASPRSRGMY
jgi:hypothetical protein